jgi:hypothetical protein
MKRRVRKIANFFAFNLLFFALYLNFIHKDKSNAVVTGVAQTSTQQNTAAFSGTVLVETPQQEMQKNTAVTAQPAAEKVTEGSTALKLSIN